MRRTFYVVEYRLKHWPPEMWDDLAAYLNEVFALEYIAQQEKIFDGTHVAMPEYRVTAYETVSVE